MTTGMRSLKSKIKERFVDAWAGDRVNTKANELEVSSEVAYMMSRSHM